MRQGRALLAAAAVLLFATIAARAKVVPPQQVNDGAVAGEEIPRTLSEFGFFSDGTQQVPAFGVFPYALKTPLYSDGAEKLRFIYLPEDTRLAADGEGLLHFPVGSALIKTFKFDGRLIETRVLLHRADGWIALPYVWDEAQTEAKLAVAGARLPVTTPAGETISYRVPNKNQCKECHGLNGAVTPIGPKARNLSGEWLGQMAKRGVLDLVPHGADSLPDWRSHARGPAEPLARAYLDVNCAHCHQPGAAASNSGLDLRWEQSDSLAIGIMKRPVAAGRGAGGHLFDVVPGKPDESILVYRMENLEGGVAMPEIGKSTVDRDGLEVVRRWIESL